MSQSPEIFNKTGWKDHNEQENIEKKEKIYAEFHRKVDEWEWNARRNVHILPCLHGTDLEVAHNIADTGFVALSSLDCGWYGKGIYFTTNCLYALPYFASKENPAVIIAYTLPGNIFPVSEHHVSTNSLMGKPVQAGYNSHYVLTSKDGEVWGGEKEHYDELMIEQESQIVPIFILRIDKHSITSDIFLEYDRETEESTSKYRHNYRLMDDMRIPLLSTLQVNEKF